MVKKVYISADELLEKSFVLARQIWKDDFFPDFLIGLWRGGAPPGIVIHEYFVHKGIKLYHTAIKTQSYRGIMENGPVEIKGIGHVLDIVNSEDKMLIVDDVLDTGGTMKAVLDTIGRRARKNTPEMRVATVYYKPLKNKTDVVPDYYVCENNNWLVFPHELDGLREEEIKKKTPDVHGYIFD